MKIIIILFLLVYTILFSMNVLARDYSTQPNINIQVDEFSFSWGVPYQRRYGWSRHNHHPSRERIFRDYHLQYHYHGPRNDWSRGYRHRHGGKRRHFKNHNHHDYYDHRNYKKRRHQYKKHNNKYRYQYYNR